MFLEPYYPWKPCTNAAQGLAMSTCQVVLVHILNPNPPWKPCTRAAQGLAMSTFQVVLVHILTPVIPGNPAPAPRRAWR